MKTIQLLNSLSKKALTCIAALAFSYNAFSQTYDKKVSASSNSGTQEGEACIAINPVDSTKMVIGFMDQGPGGLDFRIYTSNNGGNSWTLSPFNAQAPLASDFPGRSVAGGGDILFAYDKTGKLYCSWIYALVRPGPSQLDSLIMAMYWAESTDNGQTFKIQPSTDRFIGRGMMNYNTNKVLNIWDGLCDRQWMACDLSNGTNANKLYCGFINYTPNTSNTGLYVRTKTPSSNKFDPKVLAYSGNGQLSNMIVDGKGILHYIFCNIATNTVYHCSSSDGGKTFSAAHSIASGAALFPQSNKYVNDRENAAPSFAIDGANNLHVVWNDYPGGTFPNAYYSYSTDGGNTWTKKLDLSTKFVKHAFMLTVSAKGNKVTISANVLDDAKKSEYYIITSPDQGKTFGQLIKVSSGISDHASAKTLFMGDYSTSVRTNCNIFNTWTDNRANGAKQYISLYNECHPTGFQEITPVNGSYFLSSVYPNPVQDKVKLDIISDKPDNFILSLIDINGKTLILQEIKAHKGTNSVAMDMHYLPPGNYLLKVINEEQFIATRVLVKQ